MKIFYFLDKESNDETNKSILPLTPHVRSKNRNRRSTLLEDSASLEIEEKRNNF